MWFPAPDALKASSPGNAFLLCRWDEYFDPFSPESHQPRLCHLPILVDEIALVATEAQKQSGWKKHLLHLREELTSRLQEESVLKVCDPADLKTLDQIRCETQLVELTKHARALQFSRFKERYETAAIEKGKIALVGFLDGAAKNKFASTRWLGLWATIALRRNYLYSEGQIPRDDTLFTRSLTENVNAIAASLSAAPKKYLCVLPVLAVPSHNDSEPAADEIPVYTERVQAVLRKSGFGFASHQLLPGRALNSREILLTIEETGVGPIDALHNFARRLQPALTVLGFYRGASPAQSIKRGWAGPDREHLTEYPIEPLLPRLQSPRKRAVELSIHTLGAWNTGRLNGPLASALELHNLAVSSDDLRVQFVTMWSALESLAAAVPGPTIINRVTSLLVPIITWRRIEKEPASQAINIHLWRRAAGLEKVKVQGLPNATIRKVPPEDVLLAVTRPANHPDILSIFDQVAGHPLLLWRMYDTWKLYHDPCTLSDDLANARQRLTWHLWRIYRARNLLVHAGIETSMLLHLLAHLNYYLGTAISRLLHHVTHDPNLDAFKAAAHWCSLGHRVEQQLKTSPGTLSVTDITTNSSFRETECPWAQP